MVRFVRRAAILGLLLTLAVLAGSAGAAPEPCSVHITVDDEYVEAQISSTQPGTAQASGTYEATFPPLGERAVITLTGVVDTGWPISISPSTIQISGNAGRTGTFSISVVVPPGEPVQEAHVTITARMVAGGIECTPSTVRAPTIAVLPYVEELSVTTEQSLYTAAGSGSARVVRVWLGARANADVQATIAYAAPAGVVVTGPATLFVPGSQAGTANGTFDVRVQAGDLAPGTYEVRVEVSASAQGSAAAQSSVVFSVEVGQPQLPGAGPVVALFCLAAVACAARPRARARWRR